MLSQGVGLALSAAATMRSVCIGSEPSFTPDSCPWDDAAALDR